MERSKHLDATDIGLLAEIQRVADAKHDGHVTICRFTTNWRVGFGTPAIGRRGYEQLHVGPTFALAAKAALAAHLSSEGA